MNISKNLLKQIISEELRNVIEEMKYPGGHPDDEFLRNVRRQDAGIDPHRQDIIKTIEKEDPKTARMLASSLGSQENIEIMPDDPQNVMQIKSEMLELHKQMVDMLQGVTDHSWSAFGPLLRKRNELEKQLADLTGQSPSEIEADRNRIDQTRSSALRGIDRKKY